MPNLHFSKLLGGCAVALAAFVIPATAQNSVVEGRVNAVKGWATSASAGDRATLIKAYLPLAWGLDMMASVGQPLDEARKAAITKDYEQERDKLVDACVAGLKGTAVTLVEDRGTSRFSENERKEVEQMEKAGLQSGTGDVMVTDGTKTHHFRVFQYKGEWYFVDCQ